MTLEGGQLTPLIPLDPPLDIHPPDVVVYVSPIAVARNPVIY